MNLDRNRWVFWELHSKISLQLSCKSHRRLAAKVTEAEEDETIYNCLVKGKRRFDYQKIDCDKKREQTIGILAAENLIPRSFRRL